MVRKNIKGAVLAEVVMIVFIVAMFTSIVIFNLAGRAYESGFKAKAHDLAKLFKMAVTSAAESGRRYEVVLDFSSNSYLLREITTGLVAVEDIAEEEIIIVGDFDDNFQLSYVMFDDGEITNEAPALFRVGKSGWQYGGKVVLLDGDGNEHSIVINRLSRMIEIVRGDPEILMPRSEEEMAF